MSEKKITWTAKTRRGMKAIMDAGYDAAFNAATARKATKAEMEELANARTWLQQETAEDED